MEVDKASFYPLLLDLLTDISEAHFVSFDLELSGVPVKKTKSTPGRPSLQERYAETKAAAERYQILQIGLTCVQQDAEHGKYILKPYNFELSPLIETHGLDVDRDFSFNSDAVNFLLGVGFDLSVPFKSGVPYLSRAETREAREKFVQRQNRNTIADITIKPTETESLAFLDHVRTEVNTWLKSRSPDTPEYVLIGKPPSQTGAYEPGVERDIDDDFLPEPLTRFEKRLVHQLVRSEYPDLVTISKRDLVQVVRFNKEREDKITADRLKEFEARISKQKGFRWVVEALHGGNISGIDLQECSRDPVDGRYTCYNADEYKSQYHRAQALLRHNPRMLVGHNCFLDLVYIYHTFIGTLPDSVEDFQAKLHDLWPMIVDTKYMSTHNCGDINPVSSLEQIATQLSSEKTPILEIDKEHMKYAEARRLHEAGYDSFLTAQIAVRLASKLEREGSYVETNGVTAKDQADIIKGVNGMKLTDMALEAHTFHTENGTAPPGPDGFMPSVEGAKWKRRGDPTLPAPNADDPFQYNPKDLTHKYKGDEVKIEGGMPSLNSGFWRVYGNKLRVFGTEEGVCVLDGREDCSSDEDGVDESDAGVKVV